uniref:Ig-like domain-containing protein n=1 Tax=Sparus aurata TaxID=8175 RepID=A0A671XCR2_SPAAU
VSRLVVNVLSHLITQFEASPVKLSSPAGLTALIQTEQDVIAAVGDDACLSCQLLQSKEILQITWQKVLPEGEENVATYNKYFGERVNAGFQGKVEVKNNGLQNCSIVIKNVTDQDEGCYRCVFNAYPDGALIGNTCLKVYGKNLHAFITKFIEVNHLCAI